jgi:hypothetical protein
MDMRSKRSINIQVKNQQSHNTSKPIEYITAIQPARRTTTTYHHQDREIQTMSGVTRLRHFAKTLTTKMYACVLVLTPRHLKQGNNRVSAWTANRTLHAKVGKNSFDNLCVRSWRHIGLLGHGRLRPVSLNRLVQLITLSLQPRPLILMINLRFPAHEHHQWLLYLWLLCG